MQKACVVREAKYNKIRLAAMVFGIGIVIMLIAGCEENQCISTPETNIKKSRLAAVENIQLKKEAQQLQAEIQKQKDLAEKYRQEKKALKEQSKKDLQNVTGTLVKDLIEDSQKLRERNRILKEQVKQLEKEIQELKNP